MHVELIRTTTSDKLRLDGALVEPTGPPGGVALDVVLCLHGVTSNFYSSRLTEKLTGPLRELGVAVAWLNTRGRDVVFNAYFADKTLRLGSAYEIVDDARRDLAAWIHFFVRRGMNRIALWGHSLGAVKAVYTMAHEPHEAVRALVASSPPRLSYRAYMAAGAAGFAESMGRAQQLEAEGRGGELIEVAFPYPLLISASAYVDKYGPAERYNLLPLIARLPCPTLFTYGEQELPGIPFAGLPEAILAQRRADQPLEVAVVPGANHMYAGKHNELAGAITAWLKSAVP